RRDGLPGIAVILADPHRPGWRPERESIAGFVDIEAVPRPQVIRVYLRQPALQRCEPIAAVAGSIHNHAPVGGTALFVLCRRHEPGSVGILWMDGDGETKDGRFHACDFRP